MVKLCTTRLKLQALDLGQMQMLIESSGQLERELGLNEALPEPADELKAAFVQMLTGAEEHPGQAHWHTLWVGIAPALHSIVASLCFKGAPDANGRVEIGYGCTPGHEAKGYTSEIVGAATAWALTQPGVQTVTALTTGDNNASIRVLEKCGYRCTHRTQSEWLFECAQTAMAKE